MTLEAEKKWEVVIGLEIHAQVTSKSKLFSGSSTEYGGAPNSHVSLVDAAMPGMLPVLNKYCIEQAVKTGLAIEAEINKFSVFDRKNYFYPDLPQGYQISQFYKPIVQNGKLLIDLSDGSTKLIKINRIHLEQDAGKSLHDQSPTESFIDLNRSGIALMEIVTEPDFRSVKEVVEFLKKLRSILRSIGTCDGDMEKGSLRCDANISIRRYGAPLGTRCEIKNLNSFKYIASAIEYEIARQTEIIEQGGKISQETRLFDTVTGETKLLRSKESVEDYGYFPDPDLLPVKISDEYIEKIKANLPELPAQKANRYINDLKISRDNALLLSSDKDVASYFETVASEVDPGLAANWITAELFGRLNKSSQNLKDCKVMAPKLAGLIKQIESGAISGKIAKEVFDEMFETGAEAEEVISTKGLQQVSDTSSIENLIEQILSDNKDKVSEYKSGKDRLFGFFVGQVMKFSGGKMNPQIVNEILKSKLGS
jgi:aspartyl-tRNA(Asn)/glutamyl-tRNA(Gln) amidotransferase subunit B